MPTHARIQFHITSECNKCEIACNWAYRLVLIATTCLTQIIWLLKSSVIEWNNRLCSRFDFQFHMFGFHTLEEKKKLERDNCFFNRITIKRRNSKSIEFMIRSELIVRKQITKFHGMDWISRRKQWTYTLTNRSVWMEVK